MSRIAHKSFVEKEEKLRKSIVQLVKEELIKDLSSLYEERSFADINFQVGNESLPGHSAILRVRAPKFYQEIVNPILSSQYSPSKTLIHLQRLGAEKFKTFLRSVYTESSTKGIDENIVATLVFEDTGVGSNEISQNDDNIPEVEKKRPEKLSISKACCKLGEDLLLLVDDDSTADVNFILEEHKMIRAHRAILQTRSSYFAAMFCGGWSEDGCRNIHLKGIPYCGFKTVLYYLYGGITDIQVDLGNVYDLLHLADMYGLQGLKEVVSACLKIERCHLFHKPCKTCVGSICECLEVAENFHLTALKEECIRWIAKYFERVCCTKEFASICKKLQDEVLEQLQTGIALNTVISLLERCDRLSYNTPTVRWAESVNLFVQELETACLRFAAQHLRRISRDTRFLDMIKGVGWFISIVEKIFEAVMEGLTVENCCVQLKVVNQLCENPNEGENYPEEIRNLLEKLRHKCRDFIRSNLNRVMITDGWKTLNEVTRTSLTTGTVIIDVTDGKSSSPICARRLPQMKKLTSSLKTPGAYPISSASQLQGSVPKQCQRGVGTKSKSKGLALRAQGSKTGVPRVSSRDVKSASNVSTTFQQSKSRSLATSKDSASVASRNVKAASSHRFKQLSQKDAASSSNNKSRGKITRDTAEASVVKSKTGNVSKVTENSTAMGAVNSSFSVKDPNLLNANQVSFTVQEQSSESVVSKEESVGTMLQSVAALSQLNSSERENTFDDTQESFHHNEAINSNDTNDLEVVGMSAALPFEDSIYSKASSVDVVDLEKEENTSTSICDESVTGFHHRSAKTQTSSQTPSNQDRNLFSEHSGSSESFNFFKEMQGSSSVDLFATLPTCASLTPNIGEATSAKINCGKNHISCCETTKELEGACKCTLGLTTTTTTVVVDGSDTEDISSVKVISSCDNCECEGE